MDKPTGVLTAVIPVYSGEDMIEARAVLADQLERHGYTSFVVIPSDMATRRGDHAIGSVPYPDYNEAVREMLGLSQL